MLWHADFSKCIALLNTGQLRDGSWGSSFMLTVHHLFGLHLTTRDPTKEIERALDWLLDQAVGGGHESVVCPDSDLRGLPFVAGNPHALRLAMVLFLNTIFGRGGNPEIEAQYQKVSQGALYDPDGWERYPDVSNFLRAFVVHPVYSKDWATIRAVETLSRVQDDLGMWPEAVPFYQTVNALAHLDLPAADKQLRKAFMLLRQTQNEDGTWGTTEREWNTFLVVHALRRKEALA
jgi:hypothetical protein